MIPSTQVIVKEKDTDTTIDSEILPQLFSKFASKSFEDIGLELFIAKCIIEAHGGKIRVENNNNINTHREKGDTFYFTLPTINRQANLKVVVNQ